MINRPGMIIKKARQKENITVETLVPSMVQI